jgi:hypothetical protein
MSDPFIPPEDRVDVIGKLNDRLDEAEGDSLRSRAEAAADSPTDPHTLGKPEVDPKEVKEFKDQGGKDDPKDEKEGKEEPKDDKETKEVDKEVKDDGEKDDKEGKDPKDVKEDPKEEKEGKEHVKDVGEKDGGEKEPTDKEPVFEGPDGEPSGDEPSSGGGDEWRDGPVM